MQAPFSRQEKKRAAEPRVKKMTALSGETPVTVFLRSNCEGAAANTMLALDTILIALGVA